MLPQKAQAAIQGDTEPPQAAYALAVYLFAPVAVVVPLTISTAVGAATIVGERERGTGEFLAHSPAGIREIYLGKLVASLLPGYLTTIVGFGIYSLIVNLIVGPEVGGWFFPTEPVVGADALGGAAVPGPHAVARAAAVGQGEVDRGRPAGVGLVSLPLIMVAYSQSTGASTAAGASAWYGSAPSPGCWPSMAALGAACVVPEPASSASPTSSNAGAVARLDGGDELVGAAEGEAGHGRWA